MTAGRATGDRLLTREAEVEVTSVLKFAAIRNMSHHALFTQLSSYLNGLWSTVCQAIRNEKVNCIGSQKTITIDPTHEGTIADLNMYTHNIFDSLKIAVY